MEPGRGTLRVLRGSLLAALCSGLGLSAHVLGGGTVPFGPALLVVVLIAAASLLLAGRQRGAPAVFTLAALAQAGFHLVLAADAEAGHGHEMTGAGVPGLVPDLGMTLLHAGAALVAALLLARGDSLLFAIAGALRRGLTAGTRRPPEVTPVRRTPRHPAPRRLIARAVDTALRERGPPVGVTA